MGVHRFTLFGVPCLIPTHTIAKLIIHTEFQAKTT